MGDYTGGVTSALDSLSQRRSQEAQRQAALQAMAEQAQLFQQQQEERQRQMQGRKVIEQLLPQLAQLQPPPQAGAQPPMPGEPSVPMAPPPQAQPGGGGPGAGAPGGGGPPNPAMIQQLLAMMKGGAGGAPPGQPPSMPPPAAAGLPTPPPGAAAPMAKAAGPGAPPAAPGAPPAGAAPSMPPQGWQGLPKPPAPAPGGADGIAPPPEDAVMPRAQLSVGDLAKFLDSKGIKGAEALSAIEQWKPYMDTQNKQELDRMKVTYQAQAAAVRAYQATIRSLTEKQRADETGRHDREMEEIGRDRNKRMSARDAARGSGGAGDKPTWSQKTIDYYAERALGGDTTWRTGLSRTRSGASNIAAVDDRVAELSDERGSTPGTDMSNRARRTATEKALTERTKYLAAGQQFVRNFQKQADLVEKYLDKGVGGEVPVVNRWIQKGRKAVQGDPDVTAFDTVIRGLGREHQRIMTGVTSNAQLHVSAQETADELLNKDMSAEQIRSTLQAMREEATNGVQSGEDEVADLQGQLKRIGTKEGAGAPGEPAREFKSEAEARAAGLKPGTRVKINGVSGTWQ